MTIPSTINDIHSAGLEWLRKKVIEDEAKLPDTNEYKLCPDDLVRPEKRSIPWFKYVLP